MDNAGVYNGRRAKNRFGLRFLMADQPLAPPADNRMRSSYIRVLVIWVLTLAALYAFQEYFT